VFTKSTDGKADMAQNAENKVALITGANKGIGYEVTRQLAAAGATVLLGARDAEIGKAAAHALKKEGARVRFVSIDLTRLPTIKAAAESIGGEYGKLDILVNNAGILDPKDGPPSSADLDAIRRVFEVNFFGTLAVTQAMLPLVRKAPSGRIVMVSSGLGSLTLNADPSPLFADFRMLGYNGSKALVNMMTAQLASELKDTRITVNTVNPGYTATDMNDHRGTQTVAEGAAEIVRQALAGDDASTGGFFQTGGRVPW
jgi:NAD(P)-dependent dehydrogenase (short-subunit alcohol dehydrogenase family)